MFIRFGEIPKDGKSTNFLTNEKEKGISAYFAVVVNKQWMPVLPSLTGSACVTLSGLLKKRMFLVDGNIVGHGSDGEPLLDRVEIKRELFYKRNDQGWV